MRTVCNTLLRLIYSSGQAGYPHVVCAGDLTLIPLPSTKIYSNLVSFDSQKPLRANSLKDADRQLVTMPRPFTVNFTGRGKENFTTTNGCPRTTSSHASSSPPLYSFTSSHGRVAIQLLLLEHSASSFPLP
jgi:hypothetical protein